MDRNLGKSLDLMFGSEGGYSNRPTDSGGPTKYGITHKTLAAYRGVASVGAAQVKALTRDEAEAIYRKSYWSQSGGSILPDGLDYAAFDFGVNSGPATAIKTLQKLVGVNPDGVVGVQTESAVKRYPGGIHKLIENYIEARMRFLKSLGGSTGWSTNGRGWTIRVLGTDPKGQYKPAPGVIGQALAMAGLAPEPTPVPMPLEVAKALPADIGLIEIAKKPEAWGPFAGLLSAFGALFSGSGPIQYALAFGVVVLIGIGVWAFVGRVRRGS
jgi:lysozyme family protein